jgi:hypothetical protein
VEEKMQLDFDYDLDEIALIGDHYMSLRSAVFEHIERLKKGVPATRFGTTSWIRDREPGHFETQHIQALPKLPAFDVPGPLPQREQ